MNVTPDLVAEMADRAARSKLHRIVIVGGVAAGVCISLATVGLLQKMLFGLGARDTVTMITSVGVLSAVAFLAGYLPARRAMRVDPAAALRHE